MLERPRAIAGAEVKQVANQGFPLAEAKATLRVEKDTTTVDRAAFRFEWLPRPQVHFDAGVGHDDMSIESLTRRLNGQTTPNDEISVTIGDASGSGTLFVQELASGTTRGTINSQFTLTAKQKISRLSARLANCAKFHGSWISYDGPASNGRVRLETEDWQITIDQVVNMSELEKQLKLTRGYAVTHFVEFVPKDKDGVTADEAAQLLDGFSYFLSFVVGRWCSVLLAEGTSVSGTCVYKELSVRRVDSYQTTQSWHDHRDGASLQELWAGFWSKWKDDYTQKLLRSVVYTYIVASTVAGQDAGIVLGLTGIELLSWSLFIEIEHVISSGGFDDLPTADKVRLLTARLRLDSAFVGRTDSLAKWANKFVSKCENRFWAAVEVRNRLVHPRKRDQLENFADAIWDSYQLLMQTLEYGILYLCGYSGPVTDRLSATWVGETIAAPWGKTLST